MRIFLNIIWIVFGGFVSWAGWILAGCLWCITIIGIPIGTQCFKLASISLNPFGKIVSFGNMGVFSFLVNILWIIFSGIELAITNAILGCIFCITIIGIPFGKQYFKIAKLSLMPFGAEVVREHIL